MSSSTHIEKLATHALSKLTTQSLPVDIFSIPKHFGLEIIEFPFHNKISGLLKKEAGVIAINQTHPLVRKRFTIAHELGHFLLGHDILNEDIVESTFDVPNAVEREANIFAACLLMPSDAVRDAFSNNDKMDELLDKLSQRFLVSKQSMAIRLMDLKLL